MKKLEWERTEQERLERDRAERERLEQERIERDRAERERLEQERLEWERTKQERLAREKAERERLEQERIEREKADQERREREKAEWERLEREKAEFEKAEKERLERERIEREKAEKERLERERIEREKAEKERLEREKIEREKAEKERLERERIEREQAEKERVRKEQAKLAIRQEILLLSGKNTDELRKLLSDLEHKSATQADENALSEEENNYMLAVRETLRTKLSAKYAARISTLGRLSFQQLSDLRAQIKNEYVLYNGEHSCSQRSSRRFRAPVCAGLRVGRGAVSAPSRAAKRLTIFVSERSKPLSIRAFKIAGVTAARSNRRDFSTLRSPPEWNCSIVSSSFSCLAARPMVANAEVRQP